MCLFISADCPMDRAWVRMKSSLFPQNRLQHSSDLSLLYSSGKLFQENYFCSESLTTPAYKWGCICHFTTCDLCCVTHTTKKKKKKPRTCGFKKHFPANLENMHQTQSIVKLPRLCLAQSDLLELHHLCKTSGRETPEMPELKICKTKPVTFCGTAILASSCDGKAWKLFVQPSIWILCSHVGLSFDTCYRF